MASLVDPRGLPARPLSVGARIPRGVREPQELFTLSDRGTDWGTY